MRVAYVSADTGVPVFGCKGSSVHARSVIRALLAEGAQVDLFARRIGGATPPWFSGRVHQLAPAGGASARPSDVDRATRDALSKAEFPGLVYERYSLWSAGAMEWAREADVPSLLEVNAPLIEEQARHRGLDDRAGAEHVAARAFGAAARLLPVSDAVASYLARQGQSPGRVVVVPNGVDPDRFAGALPTRPTRPDEFTIGFLGTFKPWHGLMTLVDAVARLDTAEPKVRLLIVGAGPGQAAVEERLRLLRLDDAAHFTGMVEPDEVPGWLASMDVAVAPYPAMDDFYFSPLKVLEYMAAGLPVVASRSGELAALIQSGVNGMLVQPGNAPDLARALDTLRHDPWLRGRLGYAARERVARDRTWRAVARRILSLAGDVAGQSHGAIA